MPRILVIVPFPLDERNLAQRQAQSAAVSLPADVRIDYRPVRVAPSNYVSGHDAVIAELSIIEAGAPAQSEGYDAVCIDTMSDTGVTALRSLLTIPVIGPGRHSMLTALMLGRRFSILTMWDAWQPLYRKTINDLGLHRECASVRSANLTPDNRNLLAGKESDVFPRLEATARQCIDEDGADVVILGSTTMHEAHDYLSKRLPVPLVNPGPLTYALAYRAIRMQLRHSASAYLPNVLPAADRLRGCVEAGARADGAAPA